MLGLKKNKGFKPEDFYALLGYEITASGWAYLSTAVPAVCQKNPFSFKMSILALLWLDLHPKGGLEMTLKLLKITYEPWMNAFGSVTVASYHALDDSNIKRCLPRDDKKTYIKEHRWIKILSILREEGCELSAEIIKDTLNTICYIGKKKVSWQSVDQCYYEHFKFLNERSMLVKVFRVLSLKEQQGWLIDEETNTVKQKAAHSFRLKPIASSLMTEKRREQLRPVWQKYGSTYDQETWYALVDIFLKKGERKDMSWTKACKGYEVSRRYAQTFHERGNYKGQSAAILKALGSEFNTQWQRNGEQVHLKHTASLAQKSIQIVDMYDLLGYEITTSGWEHLFAEVPDEYKKSKGIFKKSVLGLLWVHQHPEQELMLVSELLGVSYENWTDHVQASVVAKFYALKDRLIKRFPVMNQGMSYIREDKWLQIVSILREEGGKLSVEEIKATFNVICQIGRENIAWKNFDPCYYQRFQLLNQKRILARVFKMLSLEERRGWVVDEKTHTVKRRRVNGFQLQPASLSRRIKEKYEKLRPIWQKSGADYDDETWFALIDIFLKKGKTKSVSWAEVCEGYKIKESSCMRIFSQENDKGTWVRMLQALGDQVETQWQINGDQVELKGSSSKALPSKKAKTQLNHESNASINCDTSCSTDLNCHQQFLFGSEEKGINESFEKAFQAIKEEWSSNDSFEGIDICVLSTHDSNLMRQHDDEVLHPLSPQFRGDHTEFTSQPKERIKRRNDPFEKPFQPIKGDPVDTSALAAHKREDDFSVGIN